MLFLCLFFYSLALAAWASCFQQQRFHSLNCQLHCWKFGWSPLLPLAVPGKVWQLQKLLSWYFEPSQPQRITSGLKTMFSLSPIYSARKSSNHKLSKNHKISPDTNLQKTYTNIKHNFFLRISPFGIAPVKRAHKAWTCWYHGPFCWFINTRFY